MTDRIHRIRLLSALPLLASCAGGETASLRADVRVRDSAGVEIVENPLPTDPSVPEWLVPDRPAVVIGTDEADSNQHLFRVRAALRQRDGGIAVGEGSGEVKLFDSTGRFVRLLVRRGRGPGEMEELAEIRRGPADSIHLSEAHGVHIFDGEFCYSRTIRPTRPDEHSYPGVIGWIADGRLMAAIIEQPFGERLPPVGSPPFRLRFTLHVVSPEGATGPPVLETHWNEMVAAVGREAGMTFPTATSLGFGKQTQAVAADRSVYVATAEAWQVDQFDPAGRLLRIIRVKGLTPQSVAERHIERENELAIEGMMSVNPGRPELPARMREQQRDKRWAETFPFYRRILLGADATLWVEEYPLPDAASQWVVFDSAGRVTARVQLPKGSRLLQGAPDFVVVRWTSPSEAEQVRVYRIRKPTLQ